MGRFNRDVIIICLEECVSMCFHQSIDKANSSVYCEFEWIIYTTETSIIKWIVSIQFMKIDSQIKTRE